MLSLSAILAVVVVFLCFVVKVFNLTDRPVMPQTFDSDSPFVRAVKASCPFLRERYVPPIWGRSGHVQTMFAGKVGRLNPPVLEGTHHVLKMKDGASLTFDVYEPDMTSRENLLNTIVIVPGIANCSDTKYVRTFAGYALKHGFRVAVLDHLGAREHIPLTSPRIFTYGSTGELAQMVEEVLARYNCHHLIGVGFSMGANVLLKYLGEEPERQKKFICALSVCQGYDIVSACPLLHDWDGFRRLYNFLMAQNMKNLIIRNANILLGNEEKNYQKTDFYGATTLQEIDEAFLRRMASFDDLVEFYEHNSSANYLHNVKLPLLLLNARDDPIVPEQLFETPRKHVQENQNAIFVVTEHGGHLGYYEGGFIGISELTWLDRSLLQYILAVLSIASVNGTKISYC